MPGNAMKQVMIVLLLLMSMYHITMSNCQVYVEAKWDNLEQSCDREKRFGCKVMLAGSITFRKQCKDCIKLDKLALAWHGPKLDTLSGSLYKKLPERTFKPLQENLICDGVWNRSSQHLILNFDDSQTLNAVTVFYIVLTIPHATESLLKKGYFTLLDTPLPKQIQSNGKKLDLALTCQTH